MVQITGALYFGFDLMNWMAKFSLIGGIYSKRLSIGNFAHFGIAAIALIKVVISDSITSKYILALAIIYLLFAITFGIVSFTNPKLITSKEASKKLTFTYIANTQNHCCILS